MRSAAQRKDQELRRVVRVCFQDEFFQRREVRLAGLDDEQHFGRALDFPLPRVVRLDPGHEIHTRDESGGQRGASKGARGPQVRRGDEYECERGGGAHGGEGKTFRSGKQAKPKEGRGIGAREWESSICRSCTSNGNPLDTDFTD